MLEYIYFVKCPGCDDEHFDFFTDAKDFAMGLLSKKPIITQIEVDRNDFGECVNSADLGTVWSWEDMMKETDAEPAQSIFTKDDLKCMTNGQDSEFDALDNSLDEHVNDRPAPVESEQELFGIDNAIVDCEVAKVITHSEDEKPLACKGKPVPEGMTIKELVEAMEENEDEVECVVCEELHDKEDCRYDEKHGWICEDCDDETVECTWCEELYDRSECRKEVDLGWLCGHCAKAQYEYANCLFNGDGVVKNEAEAFKYYQLAAQQGFTPAIAALSDMYFSGRVVERSIPEALVCMNNAVNIGDGSALCGMGNAYECGLFGKADFRQAVNYYLKAAAKGNAQAMYILALIYTFGVDDIEVNQAEALKWCKIAAGLGHREAGEMLKNLQK